MLSIGIKGTQSELVTEKNTANTVGSGTLPVYSTPSMTALMEKTAMLSVAGQLDEGCCSVGTMLNIKHVKPTLIGRTVVCESELIELDRRRLLFAVTVKEGDTVVGKGTHERFIVDSESFMEKAKNRDQ